MYDIEKRVRYAGDFMKLFSKSYLPYDMLPSVKKEINFVCEMQNFLLQQLFADTKFTKFPGLLM